MSNRIHRMFLVEGVVAAIAMGCLPAARSEEGAKWPAGLPIYDHVVIVVEENKDYNQVMAPKVAPYICNTLGAEGALFTQMYGEEHPSQGNYFWLFSGSDQGVGFEDVVPGTQDAIGPLTSRNLGEQLLAHGRKFAGYCQGLPKPGFTRNYFPEPLGDESSPKNKMKGVLYGRKHVPWVSFANVSPKDQQRSVHLPFTDFPKDFDKLPTVAFVIPDLEHDMHNGKPEDSVPAGDKWLKENLDAYYQWAKTHNSLLIVTWDENDDLEGYSGLTNPSVAPPEGVKEVDLMHGPEDLKGRQLRHDLLNHIATIFAGAHVKKGCYAEGAGITHVNILRTFEAMYGLEKCGAQQPNASGWKITDDYIITDVFEKIGN